VRAFTLTQLVLVVIALLAVAFVVPACLALRLTRQRWMRAEQDVRAIAASVNTTDRSELINRSRRFDLLAGPGAAPRVDDSAARLWQNGRTDPLTTAGTPDPWGNRYAVNVGALSASNDDTTVLWVLSAGPDGIVETPFLERGKDARPRGDDIGLHIMPVLTPR
jgi:hypothetical protein